MLSTKKKATGRQRNILDSLIYEVMDGKPIYYHGYKSVLNKTKKPEDIMGSSSLQAIIINYVLTALHKFLSDEDYWILTNEAGIHLDNKNNLAGDILIYKKSKLKAFEIDTQYVKKPADIAIEVDTKADLSIFTFQEYLKRKTTKLHQFGVDKIIWILTASRQVVVARPNEDWLLIDWNKDIEIIADVNFNIGSYLSKNGIQLKD